MDFVLNIKFTETFMFITTLSVVTHKMGKTDLYNFEILPLAGNLSIRISRKKIINNQS